MTPTDGKLVKPDSLGAKALAVVGLVFGVAYGKYCGAALFIPGIAVGLAAWISTKTLSEDRKPLTAAIAVQAGQIVWMLVGLIVAGEFGQGLDRESTRIVGIEVVFYALGLAWLVASASWPPAIALVSYQIAALGVNFYTLSELAPNTIEHKGIVATIGLRIVAVVCLISGMRAIAESRRVRWEADDEPDDPSAMPRE